MREIKLLFFIQSVYLLYIVRINYEVKNSVKVC